MKSPKSETSPVLVCITAHCKTYKKSVGISVETKFWKSQKCCDPKVNDCLKRIRIGLESELDDYSSDAEIRSLLSRVGNGRLSEPGKDSSHVSFFEYAGTWAGRASGAQRQKYLTVRKLEEIMGKFDWWDVDPQTVRMNHNRVCLVPLQGRLRFDASYQILG